MGKNKRKIVDWDTIEPLFKAGSLSNYQICEQYCADHVYSQTYKTTVTEAAIRKHANSKNWKRNLAGKVNDQVRDNLVRNEVRADSGCVLTDDEIVKKAAEKPTEIRINQRVRVQKLSETGDELELMLGNMINADKKKTKPDLSSHVKVYEKLVVSRARLQKMENDAFGLDDDKSGEGKTFEQFLNEVGN